MSSTVFVLEGAYNERDRSKRTLERDVSSPLEARVAIPEDEHERARQDEVRGGRDREEGCIHPLASRDQHAREGAGESANDESTHDVAAQAFERIAAEANDARTQNRRSQRKTERS